MGAKQELSEPTEFLAALHLGIVQGDVDDGGPEMRAIVARAGPGWRSRDGHALGADAGRGEI